MNYKLPFAFFVMLLATLSTFGSDGVEMADVMRSNGKIYVVVAVVAVVLIGLLLFMVSIDRKVSALEKKIKNNS
jgi:fluoride ion exporter CrcB/FEX